MAADATWASCARTSGSAFGVSRSMVNGWVVGRGRG